jgi:hypothetical protein
MVNLRACLRLLGSEDSSLPGPSGEPLRSIFRLGAEACEQLHVANHERAQALVHIAELERLLVRAVDALGPQVRGWVVAARALLADLLRWAADGHHDNP